MSGLPSENIDFAQGFPGRQATTGLKPSPNWGSRPGPSYSFESGNWNSRLSPLFSNPGSRVSCRDFTTNRWLRCGKFRSHDPLNSAALYLAQWWYPQVLPLRFCEKSKLTEPGIEPGSANMYFHWKTPSPLQPLRALFDRIPHSAELNYCAIV